MSETFPRPVSSPCVRICKLNDDGTCIGCGRTRLEIAAWLTLTEAARRIITSALPERLSQIGKEQANVH